MISSAPAFKAALLVAMQGSAAFAGASITWAHPGPNKIARRAVFYGNTERETEAAQLGNNARIETYAVSIYMVTHLVGDDPESAELDCWSMVDALEKLLPVRNNVLTSQIVDGVSVLAMTVELSNATVALIQEDEGWTAQAAPVTVTVTARIR